MRSEVQSQLFGLGFDRIRISNYISSNVTISIISSLQLFWINAFNWSNDNKLAASDSICSSFNSSKRDEVSGMDPNSDRIETRIKIMRVQTWFDFCSVKYH